MLAVTGYYNRPSQEGIYRHFAAMDAAVDIPIVIYNVPSRTIVDLSNDLVERLAKLPHVVGIKDATGDMARVSLQRLTCGPDWTMLSRRRPHRARLHRPRRPRLHLGHRPTSRRQACAAFFDACLAGDWEAARGWQDRLVRLHKALFLDASPSPTKFALAQLGLCSDETRLPIAPCAEAVKPAVLAAMREAGARAMSKLIAENRRARFDYFLEDKLEAGLMLTGTEVKALREGRANIAESLRRRRRPRARADQRPHPRIRPGQPLQPRAAPAAEAAAAPQARSTS